MTAPEITSRRTCSVDVRVKRDEFLRFAVRVVEEDPTAVQPTDPLAERIKRPYSLAGHQVTLVVKSSVVTPTSLLTLTRTDGLIVDDAAGRIVVNLTDERTAVMGLREDGSISWDHGVYRLRIEQPAEGDAWAALKGDWIIDP